MKSGTWFPGTRPGTLSTAFPLRVIPAMDRFLPAILLVTTACTWGDNAAAPGDDDAAPPLDVGMTGVAVMKTRITGEDYLLLLETPIALGELKAPERILRRFRPERMPLDYVPPPGATISDFATHPGGEVSILLVSDIVYALERWRPDGSRSGAVEVASVVPTYWSGDPGRISPAGDDVVLALRANDNSVRAYRYTPEGVSYRRVWESLVEPVNDLLPRGLTSGSFDTFGQLQNPFRVYADVGPDGAVWVGLLADPGTDLLERHNATFGDDLRSVSDTRLSYDVLVTQLDGAGRRVFSRMVGTQWNDEIYGMRAVPGAMLVVGRTETSPGDAGGWDGLLARVADEGTVFVRTFHVNAADIAFDADLLSDGRTVIVGGTGYTDNPSGGSISESCSLLAMVLSENTQTVLPLPTLPKHNHLRTLVADVSTAWVAGMTNGPGTHSGDNDPSAIRADPFVAVVALPGASK